MNDKITCLTVNTNFTAPVYCDTSYNCKKTNHQANPVEAAINKLLPTNSHLIALNLLKKDIGN